MIDACKPDSESEPDSEPPARVCEQAASLSEPGGRDLAATQRPGPRARAGLARGQAALTTPGPGELRNFRELRNLQVTAASGLPLSPRLRLARAAAALSRTVTVTDSELEPLLPGRRASNFSATQRPVEASGRLY